MAALLRSPDTRLRQALGASLFVILWVFSLTAAVIVGAGCGGQTPTQGLGSGEKLGYITAGNNKDRLMITTTAGGEGDSLLEWQGLGERFSFTNDGRYFTITLSGQPPGTKPRSNSFIASSDGSKAFHITSNIEMLTFSPDSTRVAFVTMPESGPNDVVIMDIASGQKKTVASGMGLLNPAWVDDKTLVYTEVNNSPLVSMSLGGAIHRVNSETGDDAVLTPANRLFSTYSAPVSWARPKVALIERGALDNLWSLDVASGQLRQVTNNIEYHFRASYLADGSRILFQKQKSKEDTMSSEVCVLEDDGSDFRMLTSNFYFDALNSFSTSSGKIVFQQTRDTGETSIWAMNDDGSDAANLFEPASGWVGDPNFVPVAGWQERNPLEMTVGEGGVGKTQIVTLRNTADYSVEAVLRAFPGNNLAVAPVEGHSADALNRQKENVDSPVGMVEADAGLEWGLKLEPGETTEVGISASIRFSKPPAEETELLLTLAVPGTPPHMFWNSPGSMRGANV